MHKSVLMRLNKPQVRAVFVLLIGLIVTACSGGGGSGKVLVWLGEGATPEQKTSGSVGQVAYLNADGTTEKLLDVPSGASGVVACGEGATSPDRRYFAFLLSVPQGGRDGGTLYQITDAGTPQAIGDAHALSCIGNGTFQYSPDSQRLAYIDYDEIPQNSEYARGRLRIVNAADRKELALFEQVGGFHLSNSGAAFLQFYTNRNNLVDEIGVMLWENDRSLEIATLFADANCRYSGAQVAPISGGKLAVVAGHRCANVGTQWQLYTMNRDGSNVTLALSDAQGGGFFPDTRTNTLFTGSSDNHLIFTRADGLGRNSVGVLSVSMDNLGADVIATPIQRGALMPRYQARTFVPTENANPVFSGDRRWWGSVVVDGSAPPVLTVLDLKAPSANPITAAVARGETISSVFFAPDHTSAYYVAGGRNGAANTLYKLNVSNGTSTEIAQGTYGNGLSAIDGGTLAMIAWQKGTDPNATAHQTLALVNPADGAVRSTLFTGITYNESGGLQSRQFAHLLAYR